MVSKAIHNEQAFEQLYDYFFPKIYHYIYYRVNSKETAEDIVSDIFFKVLRNLNSLKKSRRISKLDLFYCKKLFNRLL